MKTLFTVVCLASAMTASAQFTLIENFESRTLGEINGQGNWGTLGSAPQMSAQVVATDPLDSNNQVLHRNGIGGVYLANTINIADSTTATFFLRFHFNLTTGNDDVFGLSDVADPGTIGLGDFSLYEVQSGVLSPGNLRGRDAGSTQTASSLLDVGVWYNVWMVVDNSADNWRFFVQSDGDTDFSTQTELLSTTVGNTDWDFRNGVAANNLVSLVIKASNTGASVYYDDIYLDSSGLNLVNPIPEPTAISLLALGGLALLIRRRK